MAARRPSTVPEFTLTVPIIGNRAATGLVFQLHLVFVAFVMGIAMVAPAAELVGMRRGDPRWERLSHQLADTIEKVFSWGATWAVFGLVLLFGAYPRLFGVLGSIFFGQLVVVGALWFLMTITAYSYGITWDRLRNRKGLHNAIGWAFVAFTFVFITLISQLSSFQLTPSGGQDNLAAAATNPSWITEITHRHIGNLSYGSLAMAGFAGAWLLLFRSSADNRGYHHWMAHAVILVGLAVTLLQPFSGWFYVSRIQAASPEAWARMMPGENGWMFLMQIGLLGTVFFLGNLFMALETGGPGRGQGRAAWIRVSLIALALLTLLAVIPRELPLGTMRPWKYLSLAGFVSITAVNLFLYVRARRGMEWTGGRRAAHLAVTGMAVALVALMVTMGVIRESARGEDLIFKRMGPSQSQELVRP